LVTNRGRYYARGFRNGKGGISRRNLSGRGG